MYDMYNVQITFSSWMDSMNGWMDGKKKKWADLWITD